MKKLYCALFPDREMFRQAIKNLRSSPLPHEVEALHMTVAYRPQDYHEDLLGRTAVITICGYGNDGKNEGFLVKASSEDPQLQILLDKVGAPHITLAVAEGGIMADTAKIMFQEINHVSFPAKYGIFQSDGTILL